jgi:hypothetical protein
MAEKNIRFTFRGVPVGSTDLTRCKHRRTSDCHYTILERLAQDLQDMAAELWQFIQEEHAMVGQRHFARHRYVAPTDQAHIRDGVMGGATWAGGDQGGAVAGEARDAVNTRGLHGLGEGHRRQDGGEAAGQHRLARPWGPRRRTLWLERLHRLDLRIQACRRPVRPSQKLPAW